MNNEQDQAWFAAKRYGYGAGLPVRWQGWAVLGGYVAAVALIGLLAGIERTGPRVAAFALFLALTAAVIEISRRKTQGGWKWRWGKID